MPPLSPSLLFEDPHLIVLDKPAGLLSQGEKTGNENLVDWLRKYLGRNYVGLVHRLDRNTSGIMVVAKRTKSAQRLTAALQSGKIQRTYLGWVEGTLDHPVRWSHRLLKDEARNQVRVLPESRSEGQVALLAARPIARGSWAGNPLTLLEFELETGRSHQIRAQAAYEKHPLLGDRKYGSGTKACDFGRPALHSHRIRFPHPMSGEILAFEAPLPKDMASIPHFLTSSSESTP